MAMAGSAAADVSNKAAELRWGYSATPSHASSPVHNSEPGAFATQRVSVRAQSPAPGDLSQSGLRDFKEEKYFTGDIASVDTMSQASKLTLLGTSLFAASTIVFVHFQQKFEQQAMHQGVVRDLEQQRVKRERQLDFAMQKTLEEEYKREQNVHSSLETPLRSEGSGTNKP